MKKVVLISGKQGSGKSKTAKALTDLLWENGGGNVIAAQFRFAGPLYEMHDVVLKVLKKYGIERPELVKDGPLLQVLGTEWGRNTVDQDLWVKCCQNGVQAWFDRDAVNYKAFAVIDDCRFPNEFHSQPDDKALRVRLECDREIRKSRCSQWRENENHESEIALDGYAEKGLFDIYLDTGAVGSSPAVSARIILEHLKQKGLL